MNRDEIAFWLTSVGTACWIACFWWMHLISKKQNALLAQLQQQGKRIENLSRLEHELIKELHPQVGEIKEGIDVMVAAVNENQEQDSPVSREKTSLHL